MKLKEVAARSWRNIEAFAYALAYDEREDIEARVRRLEANDQLRLKALLSLTDQVQALSDELHNPKGWRA
jgi:hypothetical protein